MLQDCYLAALQAIRGSLPDPTLGADHYLTAMESEAARNIELQTLLRAAVALGAQVRVSLEELPEPVTKKAARKKAA